MTDPHQYRVYHNFFIHNTIADFYKETLDWLSESLFDRFQYKIISTYDKAIAFFRDQEELGHLQGRQPLPSITLDPSGEFEPSDRGGKQLWRYPQLGSKLASDLFIPLYDDGNIKVVVTFSRFKGTIDITMWMSSIYEYMDLKILIYQMFGGLDRIIYPVFFNTYIIIPEDLYNYTFHNNATGETFTIDWREAELNETIIKTTNRNEYIVPCNIGPSFSLSSLGDASEKYGGADTYGTWNLTASLNYEIEIPVSLTVMSNFEAKNVSFQIRSGVTYSKHDFTQKPQEKCIGNTIEDLLKYNITNNNNNITNNNNNITNNNNNNEDDNLNNTLVPQYLENETQKTVETIEHDNIDIVRQIEQTPETIFLNDSTSCSLGTIASIYHREVHIITEQEENILSDSTNSIDINLQERVYPNDILIVNCSLGNLDFHTDWVIDDTGYVITLFKNLKQGDLVEFLYYKPDD